MIFIKNNMPDASDFILFFSSKDTRIFFFFLVIKKKKFSLYVFTTLH